jgi:hypothetical protein
LSEARSQKPEGLTDAGQKQEEDKPHRGVFFLLLASGFWLLASSFWLLASGFYLFAIALPLPS